MERINGIRKWEWGLRPVEGIGAYAPEGSWKSDPASFCRSQNYAAAIEAGIGKIAIYARS